MKLKNIEALIDGSGEITIVRIGPIRCAAIACDDQQLAVLVRRRAESLETHLEPLAFDRVRIGSSGELCRGDWIDLCPDALYLKLTGKKPEDVFPALREQPTEATN